MGILDLFGGEDRIKKLRMRVTDLEVDIQGLKNKIDTLFMEVSLAKKKRTFKDIPQDQEQEKTEGVLLPEPSGKGINRYG